MWGGVLGASCRYWGMISAPKLMICKGFHTASNSVQNGIQLRTILVSRYIVHLDIDIGWIILIWNVMSRPLPIIIICCKKNYSFTLVCQQYLYLLFMYWQIRKIIIYNICDPIYRNLIISLLLCWWYTLVLLVSRKYFNSITYILERQSGSWSFDSLLLLVIQL